MASTFMSDVDVSVSPDSKAGPISDEVILSSGTPAGSPGFQSRQFLVRRAASPGMQSRQVIEASPLQSSVLLNQNMTTSYSPPIASRGLPPTKPSRTYITRPTLPVAAEPVRQILPARDPGQNISAQEVHAILQGERSRISEMIQEVVTGQTHVLMERLNEETQKVAGLANTLSSHSSDRLTKLEVDHRSRLEAEMTGDGPLRPAAAAELVEKVTQEQQSRMELSLAGMWQDLQTVTTDISSLRTALRSASIIEGDGDECGLLKHVQKTLEAFRAEFSNDLLLLRQNTLTGLQERVQILEGARSADQEALRAMHAQMSAQLRIEFGGVSDKMAAIASRTLEESAMYERSLKAEEQTRQLIGIVTQQQGKVSEMRAELTRCLEKDMPDCIQAVRVEQSIREQLLHKVEDHHANIQAEIRGDIDQHLADSMVKYEKDQADVLERGWTELHSILHGEIGEVKASLQTEHDEHMQTASELRSDLNQVVETLRIVEYAATPEGLPVSPSNTLRRAGLRVDLDKALADIQRMEGKLRQMDGAGGSRKDSEDVLERLMSFERQRSNEEVSASSELRRDLDAALRRLALLEAGQGSGSSGSEGAVLDLRKDLDAALERLGRLEGQSPDLKRSLDKALERLTRVELAQGKGFDKSLQSRPPVLLTRDSRTESMSSKASSHMSLSALKMAVQEEKVEGLAPDS